MRGSIHRWWSPKSSSSWARRPSLLAKRDESGATLILAVIFVIVSAVVVLALLNLNSNDILGTGTLRNQRSIEYAADGATDAAIQGVRYGYLGVNAAPAPCMYDPVTQALFSNMTLDGVTVTVECSGQAAAPSSGYRTVNFYTCESATNGCPDANLSTGQGVLLEATVVFDDVASASASPPDYFNCNSNPSDQTTCGTSYTITNWVVETANS